MEESPVNVGSEIVGLVEKTRFPAVPVVPVTEERRLPAVIVEASILLPSVATRREAVRLERVVLVVTVRLAGVRVVPSNVRLAESVKAPAVVMYGTRFEVSEETVRFVVEAVVAVSIVVEAYGMVAVVPLSEIEELMKVPLFHRGR